MQQTYIIWYDTVDHITKVRRVDNKVMQSYEEKLLAWFRKQSTSEQEKWLDFFEMASANRVNPSVLSNVVDNLIHISEHD